MPRLATQACCELGVLLDDEGGLEPAQVLFIGACLVHALATLHREVNLIYRNVVPEHLFVLENG